MNNESSKFSLRNIIVIGLFAAICYVALETFKIPIPSPVGTPFLHMGNMFVILASLLFSGVTGGLAGSIGMGIWDVTHGYAQDSYKTFILKFGIGFFTGLVASKGHKKDAKSPLMYLAMASTFFIVLGCVFLYLAFNVGDVITVAGVEKELVISPFLYIFSLILGASLLITCFLIRNISQKMQYAILGAVSGIIFNLVGEFLFAAVTLILAGSQAIPALLAAAISLPATIINGSFSIVVAVIIYAPLNKALAKSGLKIGKLTH